MEKRRQRGSVGDLRRGWLLDGMWRPFEWFPTWWERQGEGVWGGVSE